MNAIYCMLISKVSTIFLLLFVWVQVLVSVFDLCIFKICFWEVGVKIWIAFSWLRIGYNRQVLVNTVMWYTELHSIFRNCVHVISLWQKYLCYVFLLWILALSENVLRFFFSPGIFILFGIFWLQLNMFQTIKYLLGIGVVTFLCGNKLLAKIASDRKRH